MELQGQAGLSRHGGARYDGVWRVQAGMERRGESSYGLDRSVTAKQEWRVLDRPDTEGKGEAGKERRVEEVLVEAQLGIINSLTFVFYLMTDYFFRKSPHSFYTNNVEAQNAGEELERINDKYGQTTASNVVDESRPEKAVLHEAFEWNDEVAAEEHRKTQARSLIKTVRVIHPEKGDQPAFVHVAVLKGYVPAQRVVDEPELMKSAKDGAIRRLHEAEKHLNELNRLTDGNDISVQKTIEHVKKGQELLSQEKP